MRAGYSIRQFKDICFEHFFCRKRYILIFCFCFLVGLIAGIITVTQITKTFSLSDITDLLIINTFDGQVSFFGYFFKRFINYVVASIIIFGISFWFFSMLLAYPYVFFRGYQIGMNAAIFCLFYGIGGVLTVVLIYIPIQIILNFVLINFCSVCSHNSVIRRRYGKGACHGHGFLVVFLVIFFALCIIESIIIPTLFKKIILTV